MKTKILGMIVVLAMILSGTGFAMEEHKMPVPKPGSEEFERMKSLAGVWKGTSETDGKVEPAEIDYKVTSMGSAVVETLFPGTPHEMVSIYHDDENGKLTMTHYCAIGNRPQLDLKRSETDKMELELSSKSDLIAKQHMHALNLSFKGANQITQSWTCFEDGKAHHTTAISVKKM